MPMNTNIKNILDTRLETITAKNFIRHDPISIPHKFSSPDDIEVSGFLTSLISWGRRDLILQAANYMIQLMDNQPSEFVKNASEKEINKFAKFVYRTMNSDDIKFLILSLQELYKNHESMEELFTGEKSVIKGLKLLREKIISYPHQKRSEKHIADISKNSAAKRLNMFLRWMVRKCDKGIDFGIWTNIKPSDLIIPLDVHTAAAGRQMRLLTRKQNDLKSAIELTEAVREFDPFDPVKYDLALFVSDNPYISNKNNN